MPLTPASRLGRYEVRSALGAGGMGEVYRAHDPQLGREVAVKVITSDEAPSAERRHRFEDEARAAGALNHPNVLSVYDVGVEAGVTYVVFELLEGETLRDRLQREPLSTEKAVEYAAQACHGLAAAHAKGIVHRDLKPENLFLTRDGRIKILDFGLAKLTQGLDTASASEGQAETNTRPGVLLGTLAYMSPEQARGGPADVRSDLFALGATLYEMVAGRPAFRRATAADTLSAVLTHEPEAMRAAEDPAPPGLEQIVRRCLQKNPEERFQSAQDLEFALRALSGSAPGGRVGVMGAARRDHRRLMAVTGGLALAVVLVASPLLRDRRPGPRVAPAAVVPFTTFTGQEVAPSFSPDGSQIAFAWAPEGRGLEDEFHLYVQVVGGDKPLRLTTRPASWLSPAWSPDGRRIAFSRVAKDASGIYVVPALGGPERKLVDIRHGGFDYFLSGLVSWSVDGKLLAFADWDAGGGPGIALLDVATLERRRLDSPREACLVVWTPAFSPDGRSLAFACTLTQNVNELFVMPAGGGQARSITVVRGDFSGLAWTADARDLVFALDGDLRRVSAGGGEPATVLAGRDAILPAVSLRGQRLAYTQTVTNTNIWQVPLAAPTRPAGPPRKLVSSSRLQRNPAFSPDGLRVAFESTRSGTFEVWMCDADGSDPVRLTSFGGPATGTPRWSPDGRQIAFDSRAPGEGAVYVVDVEGGPPRRLQTGVADSSLPSWSRDGRWLYFSAPVHGTEQVFKVPSGGGAAIPITKGGGSYARVSLDGGRVHYAKLTDRAEIWSASVDGGDERPVPGMPARSMKWLADWVLSASGIYFVDGDPPRPGIHFLDFATGRARRVLDFPGRPEEWGGGLALAPDGRSLLFSQLDGVASDIMLIEDFR